MPAVTLAIFALTYLGLAAGRLPGLALDRTGFAVLGGVAMIATGAVSLEEAKAAVDVPTLAVLFGMMVLSALYRACGLYTAIADRLVARGGGRRLVVAAVIVVAALSAVLTNDVVCLAMTPLLAPVLLQTGVDPVTALVALACASNIGSALTPIGNPQNILIAQALDLPFLRFVLVAAIPVALSLAVLVLLAARSGRGSAAPVALPLDDGARRPFDRSGAIKAVALSVVAIALFLTPIPTYLTALGVAGVVLVSRRLRSHDVLALVDWHLLALFTGLFVVMRGFEAGGWPERLAEAVDLSGTGGAGAIPLLAITVVLSLLVGNVPAVIALLPFVPPGSPLGYSLALVSTMAGNALITGSVANLIVVEQAARLGIQISFRRHLAIGLPVTLLSLLAVALGAWIG